MGKITIFIGTLLIALGVFFYFTAEPEHRSGTAFIPSGIGLVIAILGGVSCCGTENPKVKMHTAHVAVMLTTLGALAGLFMGLKKTFTVGLDRAATAQLLMAGICAVHVFLSVKSFIAARKARETASGSAGE